MKEITIAGRTFQYKIYTDRYCFTSTCFYDGFTEIYRKKYYLFGKTILERTPNLVFEVYANIENPAYSKNDVKKLILEKLKIYDRKTELINGEII